MELDIKEKIARLLEGVAFLDNIQAIGQTGDATAVPKAGESDIDIFLLGESIPDYTERKAAYDKNGALSEECRLNVCEGGEWGTGDVFVIDGVETMLMYFTTAETLDYVNEVLQGKHLDSVRGFYPVGRLATLRNINVIYDRDGVFGALKGKLSNYPDELMKNMTSFHLERVLDGENFGRALLRKDVLYYHQVLEVSIDHYLQALYALNKTYFPSRKRTKQYIDGFGFKPDKCYERLLDVVRLGSTPEGIEDSYSLWQALVHDLQGLAGR